MNKPHYEDVLTSWNADGIICIEIDSIPWIVLVMPQIEIHSNYNERLVVATKKEGKGYFFRWGSNFLIGESSLTPPYNGEAEINLYGPGGPQRTLPLIVDSLMSANQDIVVCK